MTWHFSILTPIFILNVAASVWVAIMLWRYAKAPGIGAFSILLLASAFWSFTHMLEVSVDQYWAKIFWNQTEYLGSVLIAPAWFIFTCYYSRHLKRFPVRYIVLLMVMPTITVLLAWTNPAHHLIWTSITPSPDGSNALVYAHGIWFWIAVVYDYALLLAGVWYVYQVLRASPQDQRLQPIALLIGACIPFIANLLYVAGLSPLKNEDVAPIFLTFSGFLYLMTVFRLRLFDIRRVARATIIDIMRDGMLIIDEKNHLVDVNPSALELLSVSSAIIEQDIALSLAQYPAILDIIHSPKTQPVTVALNDPASGHLDIQVTELHDLQGNPGGKLVILRDVSERLIAEKAAFESAIEQQRHKLLTQFIRDISHEFRTPLSVINTSLYLMEKSNDPEQQRHRREVIQFQTKRLDSLISEMLMAAQVDSNSALELTRIDLNSLLKAVTEEQKPLFTAKRQELIVQPSKEAIQIVGDVLMLQKALVNILQNASRYTPDDGTITVTGKSEGGIALVEIADTGIGMSAETKAHIFERFFRADEAHSTPGFGLGLPIAQTIIEKHHGQIDVESTLGAGSTFTIRLPQNTPEAMALPGVRFATG